MTGGAPSAVSEEDLERWTAAFRGPLVGLLASWGRDWRAADELAQDCFAEAWMSRERFVGDPRSLDAAGAWLRGIAFRLHAASGRREAVRATSPLELEPASAFEQLSGEHQLVLRMHYLEGTSAREVAALLGLTAKAVEGRLYQARRALRRILERDPARSSRRESR
jgi:DNA-directed RNA polymerase specialized sigma24 family protein